MTSRSRAALRAKRCRQRRRDGVRVYPVPTGDRVVETLINGHWLTDQEANDPAKIGQVLGKLIADWDQAVRRNNP